jgi:two-component system sensor histidine kinase KdpD
VIVGFAMAVILPVLLQLLLAASPSHSIATAVLLQLTGSVAVALVGGLWPALLGALWSSLLVNFFSIPPVGTLTISDPENILALLVFVGVSAAVAAVVDVSARRSKEAARARAEAATLGDLTRGASSAEDTVEGLLRQALDVFQMRGAALFRAGGPAAGAPGGWRLVANAGEAALVPPDGGENTEQIDAGTRLVLSGRILPASDRRLLSAFGAHLSAQLERRQLAASRREVTRLAESNTMRTSILRAVSHDLRTPLAGIKLAVGGLRQSNVHYTPEEEQELLATIEECSDRLDVLVGNLLDMSRITSDSVNALIRPVRWYEVIPTALHGIPQGRVRVDLPGNMPEIDADAGMLERVIANIVENAIKYAPDSDVVLAGAAGGFSSSALDGRPSGELRIIDHGQGVPAESVVRMFQPFQRVNDVPSTTGVGLGLAVAKGFTEAMGGTLTAEETPGGGLTMVIRLPLSTGVAFPHEEAQAPMEAQSVLLERRHVPPSGSSDSASGEAR